MTSETDWITIVGTIASVIGLLLSYIVFSRSRSPRPVRLSIRLTAALCVVGGIALFAALTSDGTFRIPFLLVSIALAGTIGALLHRQISMRSYQVFGPSFREGEYIDDYFAFMPTLFDEASEEICISGAGFDYSTLTGRTYAQHHIEALGRALRRGVRVSRLQTTREVSEEWAASLRKLKEDSPRSFHLYLSTYDRTDFADITVIDSAHEKHCAVEVALSTPRAGGLQPIDRISIALVVRRRQILAKSLADRFNQVCRTEADEVRDPSELGSQFGPVFYFAYGSNIARDQMRRRCRSAEAIGYAEVPGYELVFDIYSPRWKGGVANLRPNSGQSAPGLLYKISRSDLKNLDEMERDLYARKAVAVRVTLDGEVRRYEAMVYIAPQDSEHRLDPSGRPSTDYLEKLQEGAREHEFPPSWWVVLRASSGLP